MKRLMILIIITAFFTACDKDDDPIVFPKSIAEMNAERILSYKVNLVSVNSKHIPSEIQTTFISFTIEMPFFVVRHRLFVVGPGGLYVAPGTWSNSPYNRRSVPS